MQSAAPNQSKWWLVALLLALTFSLALWGCAAPATPAPGEPTEPPAAATQAPEVSKPSEAYPSYPPAAEVLQAENPYPGGEVAPAVEPMPEEQPYPLPPPDTTLPTEAPVASATPQAEWLPVEIPEAGMSFAVPRAWLRLPPDWAWLPNLDGTAKVGFAWKDIQPPQEATAAFIPTNAVSLGAEEIELSWGTGSHHTIEVRATGEQVESVQVHYLIRGSDNRVYDFYASAATAGELAALQPILEEILTAARPLQ